MQIHNKLSELQKGLKRKYKNYDEFLNALQKLCKKVGCVTYTTNEIIERSGSMFTRVEFIIADTDYDGFNQLSSAGYCLERAMMNPHLSYIEARNKAAGGLFNIEIEDTCNMQKPLNPKQNDIEAVELKQKVMAYIKRVNMPVENINKICKVYKIEKIEDMTAEDCRSYIRALEAAGGNIDKKGEQK